MQQATLTFVLLIMLSAMAQAEEARFFPLANKTLKEKGVELPLPFGISVLFNRVKDETEITKLTLPWLGEVQAVNFKESESKTDAFHLRADLWILPCMNIYAVGGRIDGDSKTTIEIRGTGPSANGFEFEIEESFHGTTIGIGTTLVYAFTPNWIASLDFNYTEAELDVSDSDIKVTMIAPRVTWNMRQYGLPAFVGAGIHYLDAEQTLSVKIPTHPPMQDITAQLHIKNKKKWNLALSGGFEVTRHWHISAVIGFYDRTMFLSQLSYRF